MSLTSFREAPKSGHLYRVKRIYRYLSKMKYAVIRIRTDESDLSALIKLEFDWKKSVYGNMRELIPEDAPKPLGKFVTIIHYVDANLMHFY